MSETLAHNPPDTKRRVVLLSGMSGAGLSTALKVFEDLDYEAVDNLRLGLIPALVESGHSALAVAIDTRNADFSADGLLKLVRQLKETKGLDAR